MMLANIFCTRMESKCSVGGAAVAVGVDRRDDAGDDLLDWMVGKQTAMRTDTTQLKTEIRCNAMDHT